MAKKPTYEELEKRIHELERVELERKQAEEELQLTQFAKKATDLSENGLI